MKNKVLILFFLSFSWILRAQSVRNMNVDTLMTYLANKRPLPINDTAQYSLPFFRENQERYKYTEGDSIKRLCGCSLKANRDSIPNEEYVQKDLNAIENSLNKLLECNQNTPDLNIILSDSSSINLGYDLRLLRTGLSGGYTNFELWILYSGKNVLKVEVAISSYSNLMEKYYLNRIQVPLQCINEKLLAERTCSLSVEKYNKRNGKLYLVSDDTNTKRKNAINFFTGLSLNFSYLDMHIRDEYWGEKAFGYIQYFIANGDYEALENILFSPIPASRLLAATTLQYLQKKHDYNNKGTSKRVNEILKGPATIYTGSASHSGFPTLQYDVLKYFEYYLKTL